MVAAQALPEDVAPGRASMLTGYCAAINHQIGCEVNKLQPKAWLSNTLAS
jgi:hypothetical protein